MAPFFKLYAAYGTNYESANEIYQKEMKENTSFKDAVETKNLEAGGNTALHHLLIMPIQRIPRYNMLLGDIIKNTDESHPDYKNLISALESTKKVANHLNESVREYEAEKSMMDLAERMDIVFLLAPSRHLIKEGAYRVIIGKKEKHNLHHVMLFNDIFVCISRSKIRKSSEFINPLHKFPISLVWIDEIKGESKQLKFTMPDRIIIVCFESEDEVLQWKDSVTSILKIQLESQPKRKSTSLNENPSRIRFGSFIYSNHHEYEGWFWNGLKQGSGKLKFYNCIYEGNFVSDTMCGSGKIIYPTGEMYTGQWENGLQNGTGTYGSPLGELYDGEWINGKKQGKVCFKKMYYNIIILIFIILKGKYNYNNGDSYNGEWISDLPHGNGKFIYSSGKRYNGGWIKGQRSGHGNYDLGNGDSYEGEWLNDKMHGIGTFVEKDGSYYEGSFVNGYYEGTGTKIFKDGRKYSGTWKENKPNGNGIFNSAVGWISSIEGEWLNGYIHGKNIIQFANGDKYTGFIKDNRVS